MNNTPGTRVAGFNGFPLVEAPVHLVYEVAPILKPHGGLLGAARQVAMVFACLSQASGMLLQTGFERSA